MPSLITRVSLGKYFFARAKHLMNDKSERIIYYIRAYDCLFSDDYPSFKQMMKLAIDECKKNK